MFADPRQVTPRRLRRRLKAAASIVLALAAGAFLACHRQGAQAPPPRGPEASPEPAVSPPPPAPSTPSPEAGLAVVDAGSIDRDAQAPAIDRGQHRRGLPVRDNLLE